MKRSINDTEITSILTDLRTANLAFQKIYPGDSAERQPVHTVYGGAQLFKYNTASYLGQSAMKSLKTYAPNFVVLAKAMHIDGHESLPDSQQEIDSLTTKLDSQTEAERRKEKAWLPYTVYKKIVKKLENEPVEDFRIDFEDGFGNRTDVEEDQAAVFAAQQTAKGMAEGTLPPFIGIRIKPFTEDLKSRSIRTLDLYLTALVAETGGKLPANFIVMFPKVAIPEQVKALVKIFEVLEQNLQLPARTLKMEMMVETTQAIMDLDGTNPLRRFILASEGRMIATHFGTYDYTASCNITAKYQTMDHPVCDFAHHVTKVALAHTGIFLSDGATNVMPVGPHRGENLTAEQLEENQIVVHRAWKMAYDHVRHSLWNGFYQGWDLHPSQLVVRYAAVFTFFLESYADAALRLNSFMSKAAQATLTSDIFDDAATGQGLLNFFLRALNSGAISLEDIEATGLTIEEIRTRSFFTILEGRRNA